MLEPNSEIIGIGKEIDKLNDQVLQLQKKVKRGLSIDVIQDKLLSLRSKIQSLEEKKSALIEKENHGNKNFTDGLNISGVIDFDAFIGKNKNEQNDSDMQVSTVELSIQKEFSKSINSQITFLYEDGQTEFDVDQAFINDRWGNEHVLTLSIGKKYAPLGVHESKFISDPLTLDMTEVVDGMVELQYDWKDFTMGIFGYNGPSKVSNEANSFKSVGAFIEFANSENRLFGIIERIRCSYLNNAGDTTAFSGNIIDKNANNTADDHENLVKNPSIWTIQTTLGYSNFSFIAEYVSLTRAFDSTDLKFNNQEAKIRSWQTEISYHFLTSYSFQVGYQGTEKALSLQLPEKRYITGLTWEINDHMNLNLEHRIDSDYKTDYGGTSNADRITSVQWEAVFF